MLIGVGLIAIAVAFVIFLPKTSDDISSASTPGEIPASIPGEMNYPAPALTLTDMQDQTVSLADYKGQWVLVNNWATWCPPCRAEMPELNAFFEAHKDEGFVFVLDQTEKVFLKLAPRLLVDSRKRLIHQKNLGVDT